MSIIKINYRGYESGFDLHYSFINNLNHAGFILLCKEWLKETCKDNFLIQEHLDLFLTKEDIQIAITHASFSFRRIDRSVEAVNVLLNLFFDSYDITLNKEEAAMIQETRRQPEQFNNLLFFDSMKNLIDLIYITPEITFNDWIKIKGYGELIEIDIDDTFEVWID
tara:strand:+ start:526 stop:1023 length:498 start_codon:yes stop_codon:yes gene_type:complete